jgi:hypothetical protein
MTTAKRQDSTGGLPTCAVRLVDRRTGSVHRVNGAPLIIYSRHPAEAAAELLRHRDASLWDVRVEALPAAAPAFAGEGR